ncbi:unnamed protein product [Thelazia callipaeda]|uniref:SEFIR domain-containing protein n=1 Tax=Thelazia callipaeda TaxID=103827 RepID=A0A0N5CMA9_THECL|nr:unnamed protein product [Thelazia callipaeda]
MRVELLIFILIESIFCKNTKQRLMTLLKTNLKFYDQWIHLVEQQHRQKHQQNITTALKQINHTMMNCTSSWGMHMDHVDNVRPADIQLYAELGQLTRYCEDSILKLITGELDSCQHASYTSPWPSIVKLLMNFNRNMTVIESSHDKQLENQTEYLVQKFIKHKNWRNKWKMIVIMPSMEDGEPKEPEQSAVKVMKSIKRLYEVVPYRTVLIVVRSSSLQLWRDASNAHRACQTLLQPWKLYEKLNPVSVWDQIEKICDLYFQNSHFTVQILPLLKNSSLAYLTGTKEIDLSLLGHDCVHFSPHGLSLLHVATWNALFTKSPDRSQNFDFSQSKPQCADPICPFIRTSKNSAFCVWNPSKMSGESHRSEQLIAISVLLVATILFVVIISAIFYLRKRYHKFDEISPKLPVKPPVGINWTSWKYIDDDNSVNSICYKL